MESVFKIKTKEGLLEHLHYIKRRKQEREAEAIANYQSLLKATDEKRRKLYATFES